MHAVLVYLKKSIACTLKWLSMSWMSIFSLLEEVFTQKSIWLMLGKHTCCTCFMLSWHFICLLLILLSVESYACPVKMLESFFHNVYMVVSLIYHSWANLWLE